MGNYYLIVHDGIITTDLNLLICCIFNTNGEVRPIYKNSFDFRLIVDILFNEYLETWIRITKLEHGLPVLVRKINH